VPPSRIKLSDVAQAAGVSIPTASLVLSGRGDELRISQAVQAKIQRVAAELGYRRNSLSVGLRTGATNTIGFISDTITTAQYAGDMIRGALDAANDVDYMLLIAETGGESREESRATDALIDRQVEGLVFASMFTRLRQRPQVPISVPVVLLNAIPVEPDWAISAVIPDELVAGEAAAQRLLSGGHRRIHLLGAGSTYADMPTEAVAARERFDGIHAALAKAGVEPASYHGSLDWEPEDGYRLSSAFIGEATRGEAIITFNDRLALGLAQAMRDKGYRIPDDISVISFDDEAIARQMRPGLTTMALPHYELGRLAIELLLTAIKENQTKPNQSGTKIHRIKMPLRERASILPKN